MTNESDRERLAALEKRVAELAALVRFQDSNRVQMEKNIGAIDQQLIKTDSGLHQVRRQMAAGFRSPKGKPVAKTKTKTKTKPKPSLKPKPKPKPKGRKRK